MCFHYFIASEWLYQRISHFKFEDWHCNVRISSSSRLPSLSFICEHSHAIFVYFGTCRWIIFKICLPSFQAVAYCYFDMPLTSVKILILDGWWWKSDVWFHYWYKCRVDFISLQLLRLGLNAPPYLIGVCFSFKLRRYRNDTAWWLTMQIGWIMRAFISKNIIFSKIMLAHIGTCRNFKMTSSHK